jgi:hypothetical protein
MAANRKPLAKRKATRVRLEQLARNADCQANVISAVLDIPANFLVGVDLTNNSKGKSQFAAEGGVLFEKSIFRADASGTTRIATLLKSSALVDEDSELELVDLRLDDKSTVADSTRVVLSKMSDARDSSKAYLFSGFRFNDEEFAMNFNAEFEIDLLLLTYKSELKHWEIRIGEVKTYPNRHGLTDSYQLATARAQAGLYSYLLPKFMSRVGAPAYSISEKVFLVLSSVRGRSPEIWPNEDIKEQTERAKKAVDLFQQQSDALRSTTADAEAETTSNLAISSDEHVKTAYKEECWTFCDLAEHCLRQLVTLDHPRILGAEVEQVLGERTIEQVQQLLATGNPLTEADVDLLTRLHDAEFESVVS